MTELERIATALEQISALLATRVAQVARAEANAPCPLCHRWGICSCSMSGCPTRGVTS